ncbi:hypothetical protein BABINDRAFT_159556 [Babjeviella inositovora NRRL Y-12698]|uniref:ABC transporter domain-containing protein n=1 Tax=Babjeviella inositovora NRRL Y-12698 TaxID=984486 RepID=A0A1E3QZJ2_9ASCO|nr:uncharacterized protein BABINDRAFT_159556 [Babjeviella inositovora NRRL Y-12698]ODQ83099.1 hypothetical protein BABINDRAFT_159556 [Babjeviella inositovora NRRL Y-12698]
MTFSESLAIPEAEQLGLSVRNLSVSVGKALSKRRFRKQADTEASPAYSHKILNDVSFDLRPGKLMAIMGGSGSGKTTLLNVLSQRTNVLNKNLQFGGAINFVRPNTNTDAVTAIRHAYMLQTSLFLPGLTVYETLKYAADLRLPPSVAVAEKAELIAFLLDQLNLTKISQCIICSFKDPSKSSLSGGEQRRVSLAIQLLTRPAILFLDEPTTGLDSASALSLVQTLSNLTKFGMTVILSIHQPRLEILDAIDEFCLLGSGGRVIYYGNLATSLAYFESIGVSIPADGNVLDYLMELSVKDSSTVEEEVLSVQRINDLVAYWKTHSQKLLSYQDSHQVSPESRSSAFKTLVPLTTESTLSLSPQETAELFRHNLALFHHEKNLSLYQEIVVLTKRTFLLTYRDLYSLLALNGGAILLSFVLGWMFYRPNPDLAGIRSITSSMYAIIEVVGFCPLFFEATRLWSLDGVFFFREKNENLVSVTGFLISRRLAKFLLEDLAVSVIFSVVTYFMYGLRTDIGALSFFVYFSVCLLIALSSMTLGMLGFAASRDFSQAGFGLNMMYQFQNCACGYFVNASTMPVYVRWTKYISYFWYAFGALTANEFTGWEGDCGEIECPAEYSGAYTLKTLGYPQGWRTVPIICLFLWVAAFYTAAAILLHFKTLDVKMSKSKEPPSRQIEPAADHEIEKPGVVTSDELGGVTPINIHVRNVSLQVEPKFKMSFATKKEPISLLNDVNADLKSGKVNVIMGPSGSGKTTLLNLLANRLGTSSTYIPLGDVSINGVDHLKISDLGQYASYVLQSDDMLVPYLSVRETLILQATLRLPGLTHSQICLRVESLIRRMGLIDCAGIRIGSEFVKGISGGEKRRVSIAIQILDNPRILFLDEPTSGLDSKTATSIVMELQELAARGTTVVLTIHQPKQELFDKFGNVLLLARGGFVVFNGLPALLVAHFRLMEFVPPPFTNVSDFILDVVTRGHGETIEMAQSRIDTLISKWKTMGDNITGKKTSVDLSCTDEIGSTNRGSASPTSIENSYVDSAVLFSKYGMRTKSQALFFITFLVICKRSIISVWRCSDILISKVFQTIAFSILIALYFAPLKNDASGIANRLGLIQEGMNFIFLGFLNNVACYPAERNTFYAEYDDNIYGPLTFMLSYFVQEVPYEIFGTLFFSVFMVLVCGLPRDASMYFTVFYSTFVLCNCGESLGIFFNTVFAHQGIALNMLTAVLIIGIFMGGTMSLHMPPFFRAWNWINPGKYLAGSIATLGFQGARFECGDDVTDCLLNTGDAVLDYYGLKSPWGAYLGALTVCLVAYRIVAYLLIVLRMRYFR